tara:strand:+ start:10745 stop:11035 length:291 start_codon:yes stop_codon:yes gene_type:complete
MEFKEYYEHYLTLHQNKWCRRLHALGQITTIAYVVFCLLNSYWIPLLAAPFVIYPFAWSGHFFFEKNKPAAWSRPIWAKACDWVMLKDMIVGKVKF